MVKPKTSALEVAKYLLSLDARREYFTLNWMTPKKDWESRPREGSFRLNKMLHICQMLYCAKYQVPLFREQMLAFEHGGVIEEVRLNFIKLHGFLGQEESSLSTDEKALNDLKVIVD